MKLAVIGGGPVGLVMALLLNKEGHEVHLYEKGKWPKDKACGQGLMPSGLNILEALGVTFKEGEEAFSFKGVQYNDGLLSLGGTLPREGLGIERKVLSQKLVDACQKERRIKLFDEMTVTNIQVGQSSVRLNLEDKERKTNFDEFDYAFACDGLNSFVRKKLANRKVRSGVWRMGAREHFDCPPWSNKVEVYWQDGVEAYVTPVNNNKVEVAFLWFEDALNPLEETLLNTNIKDQLWRRFPELRKKLSPYKTQKDFRGYGPFSTYAERIKKDRVFFAGDAYCFVDGITGEGLSLGFKGAQIIARNFLKWKWWHALQFKLHYFHYTFMVRFALALSYNRRFRRMLFRMVQKVPKSFNIILKLNDF